MEFNLFWYNNAFVFGYLLVVFCFTRFRFQSDFLLISIGMFIGSLEHNAATPERPGGERADGITGYITGAFVHVFSGFTCIFDERLLFFLDHERLLLPLLEWMLLNA